MSILVGRKAPDFTTAAVLGNGSVNQSFSFSKETKGKYTLVFFYPLDFTFVCPTELIALHKRMPQFKKRGIEVIAVSIDSHFTHLAWRNTPVNKGGVGELAFTMAADMNHQICQSFGVEHPEAGVAFRGAFVIDKNGIVRSQIVNDLPLGRNVDELIRLFDALSHHEQHGEVCPAGWQSGDAAMHATPEGVAKYLSEKESSL